MEDSTQKPACLCGSGEYIVLACSGSCDLGLITDRVARKLRDNKVRRMSCLAAVGANLKPTIESMKSTNILLLDGCPVDCGKHILDLVGITGYNYIRMTDLGYKKGETPVTDELINTIYEKVETIY